MVDADAIGSIAAVMTTVSFLPQTIKTIRSRDTTSISLAMYALFSAGVGFWLAYGLLVESRPIIIANVVTLALASTILFLKARDVLRRRPIARPPPE
jgi:MtN3 and saliva related transmembrane protein